MDMADGHLTEGMVLLPSLPFALRHKVTQRSHASVGERTACLYGPLCTWTWINFQSQNASSVT